MSRMTTKRPKKTPGTSAASKSAGKPKAAAGKKKKPAAKTVAADPADSDDLDGDDDDEPAPAPAAKPKPSPARKSAQGAGDVEAPVVVPARRLTPEARAAVNAMVAKGVSLQEALRATAKWETFVAPVREPPQPGGPGERPGKPEGGGGPGPRAAREEDDEPADDGPPEEAADEGGE